MNDAHASTCSGSYIWLILESEKMEISSFSKMLLEIISYFMLLVIKCNAIGPQQMSIVINKDSSKLEDYVHIPNPPEILLNRKLKIEFRCTGDKILGAEVKTKVDQSISRKIFQRTWKCNSDNYDSVKSKVVKIKMPPSVAYNYDMFNTEVQMTSETSLRAWIVEDVWWPSCYQQGNCYTRSKVKVTYDTEIPPPFSRPFYRKSKRCRKWSMDILTIWSSRNIPTCAPEKEVVEMIQFPVVLGGKPYGIYRQFEPYTNPELESRRLSQLHRPRFTVSMWLYILEYCRTGRLCSVFQHFNRDIMFRTMLFFIDHEEGNHSCCLKIIWDLTLDEGQINDALPIGDGAYISMVAVSTGPLFTKQKLISGKGLIQVSSAEGDPLAAVTGIVFPQQQWIRVVIAFEVKTWYITVNYGPDFNETLSTHYVNPSSIYMDDTEGMFVFGGAEVTSSFRGYIGQATWYRNKVLKPEQIPFPRLFHPMFELKLTRREERCQHYIDWVSARIAVHHDRRRHVLQKDACQQPFVELINDIRAPKSGPTCVPSGRKHSKHWVEVDKIVKKMVWANSDINFKTIADRLYANATALLDESMDSIPAAFPLLKQSACYGNYDAMFMVSVILNNGIFKKADEIQSQAYLMLAALDNHRLSCMALGHKHRYGLDGVPEDLEQSFRYYKYVADTTREDKELHKDSDVMTESIRLTDELAINQQTDEDGDIFHWLKHQAQKGILSAQNKVGRALFWGSQGLKRNMEAAVEYFKMSADTGDAQSQYDYGIVLLRGQGTKKDMEAGLSQLHKSAEQNNPHALNAIGWYAKHHEKDINKAADYFMRAFKKGNAEAAYNLGIMYLYGEFPGEAKNSDKAFEMFNFAGTRGHIDGGVGIAYMMIKGTERYPRSATVAVEWSRFIAEKNPAIGYILRKGIKAYRNSRKDVSLFYYLLAADAGLEVGSFNVAWLCEDNQDGVTSFIAKDCVWRLYNISTQREMQFVDSYALIKMGDYNWYGCEGHKNETLAMKYYAQAIKKGDPHALFNLGFMVEEGVDVPHSVLAEIGVPASKRANNITLLEHLYTRCKSSRRSEAYIPCSMALWKVQFMDFWNRHQVAIKISSYTGIAAITALSVFVILRTHLRSPTQETNI